MKTILAFITICCIGFWDTGERSVHLKYEGNVQEDFIVYSGFVIKYNEEKKVPAYTIHRLTPKQISKANGERADRLTYFKIEQAINPDSRSNSKDYKGSGYDRGHMVPAGDFYWNKFQKDETFVYSNVSPQNPIFNRKLFRSLENKIRERIEFYNSEAYIITGTIYPEKYKKVIGQGVGVPASIYKIVFFPRENRMSAFLLDNTVYSYTNSLSDFLVRVDDLERLTGEDFFDQLEPAKQQALESSIQNL